jgi:2-oxoacid:acceptor oxidoreductase delta subunit (pyruvate/2-ketoisovalerate family)
MAIPFAITLQVKSSLVNHTGTWRDERPVYVDRQPPCNAACPAGEQIQGWLYDAEDGSYERAWRHLVLDNPLPAVLGRVCYHPCEKQCNRAHLDDAVGINSVEQFLGDEAIRQGWQLPAPAPDTGLSVLVVGAGPAGLSAAYQLRLLGHRVVVRDSSDAIGGMMRSGIPTFRLPRDVLDSEVARILELGVDVQLGHRCTDLNAELAEGFDAAFLALGAQLSRRTYIPAGQSSHLLDALTLLNDVAHGERPQLGRRVAIYGGGNTAMDAARTARRLGADDAVVVYRRTRAQMPADEIEINQAIVEGVQVRWLSTISAIDSSQVRLERMRLDPSGVPQPTGVFEELDADTVILALGQQVDHSMVDGLPDIVVADGVIEVDQQMMTGHPGVFAGGDMVSEVRSVAESVGQGKRAASAIDRWLHGVAAATSGQTAAAAAGGPVPVAAASFDLLNPWYYSDAPVTMREELNASRRTADFGEVVQGLDADTALFEARRCLSCGNCFGCDNCYGMCPDNAIHKTPGAPGQPDVYSIDYDYCKGCGICVSECPSGAIQMVPEQI